MEKRNCGRILGTKAKRRAVELVQDELDEYLDVVCDQLEQILVFSDSEEEDFCFLLLDVLNNDIYIACFESKTELVEPKCSLCPDSPDEKIDKLLIMKRQLYHSNPDPEVVFEVSGIFLPLNPNDSYQEKYIYVMSDNKNFLNLIFFMNRHSIEHNEYMQNIKKNFYGDVYDEQYEYFLFSFNLRSKDVEIYELGWDILNFSEYTTPIIRMRRDGKIIIFHRYYDNGIDTFKISTMLPEYGEYCTIELEADFILNYNTEEFNFYNDLVRAFKYENGFKWFLLDDDGKLSVCDTSGILRELKPIEDSDPSFLEVAKHDQQSIRALFIENDRLFFICSYGFFNDDDLLETYNHDLFQLDIFENDSSFRAVRKGRVERMYSCDVLFGNGIIIANDKDACKYGFFRVPTLAELAFIQIQKTASRKIELEDKAYSSERFVYEGGISEHELKKTLGFGDEMRLLPLLDRF